MKPSPIQGPLMRLARADEHIAELTPLLEDYLAERPTALHEEIHPDGRHKVVKLRLTKLLPPKANILVGDACSSLRSALDQLACALARQNGAADTTNVYFPVADSLEKFNSSETQRKVSKLSPEAVTLIASLKPYRDGNEDFWSLHKLRITDFHHDLISVGADCLPLIEQHNSPFDWHRSMKGETFSFGGFPWDYEQNGMDVAIVPSDIDMNDRIGIRLDVIFREPETIAGLPVLGKLHGFRRLVERTLFKFRDRFFS